MIPKIIHQTWKDSTVPEKFLAFQKKVKDLHPDWEYRLWTDADNLELVKQHYPELVEQYIALPKNIMRADIIRYLIMYKFGGVYLDLDYEMLKPFDILDYGLVLPYNRNIGAGDDYDGIGNCIFGSAPGHAFWKFAIEDFKNIKDYSLFFKSLTNRPYITKQTTLEEALTGPGFLSRIFFDNIHALSDYYLPARDIFHPKSSGKMKELSKLISEGKSYGIHHCYGTWRNSSVFKKILSKISPAKAL